VNKPTDDGPPARDRSLSPRGQQREKEILDAAAEVFSHKGYAAANVEDVAARVGMLKGSLYYYISSKEDLLYRLTKSIHFEAFETFDRSQRVGGTAADRLASLVRLHFETLAGNVTKTRVFYTEFAHLKGERYHEIVGLRRQYEASVEDLIREGQGERLFCVRRDPHAMMLAILTLLNSIQLWYRSDGESSAEHLAEEYASFVVNGLRCHGAGRCTCEAAETTTRTPEAADEVARSRAAPAVERERGSGGAGKRNKRSKRSEGEHA
jgi:TetR/AcrR family transcriptional regulator, cholesterol catabolism regulator